MLIRLFSFLVLSISLSSCHVGRFFTYNFADIRDHKKFPKMDLAKGSNDTTFQFHAADSNLLLPTIKYKDGKNLTVDKWMKKTGTVAFLIIRNDSILFENYRHKHGETVIVPSFSVAKSFTSALMGIAIEEGHIDSVQESIRNYLPKLPQNHFQNITLEHLLNMRSGLRFNEGYVNPFGHVAKFYYGTNLIKFTKKLKAKEAPNKRFEYNSGNTFLLGWAVEEATGQKLPNYLEEKLWKPLGMEYSASWSLDSKKHKMAKAFCCINARARDFARFGRLYLNYGEWEGKQLVPRTWVEASTNFKGTNGGIYKYQWWRTHSEFKNDFQAQGILGQFIYVNRDKNIIIVRLGKKYGKVFWPRLFKELAKQL